MVPDPELLAEARVLDSIKEKLQANLNKEIDTSNCSGEENGKPCTCKNWGQSQPFNGVDTYPLSQTIYWVTSWSGLPKIVDSSTPDAKKCNFSTTLTVTGKGTFIIGDCKC